MSDSTSETVERPSAEQTVAGEVVELKDLKEESKWVLDTADLAPFRVKAGYDIFVVPNFAQDVLGIKDPRALLGQLEAYPSVGAGARIVPNVVQWVTGDNRALMYRGNVLKRGKIWLQRGDPKTKGYRRYYYTGWQWNILPATADVELCPEVEPIADAYDDWAEMRGVQRANHYIVTKYKDGSDDIGFHTDKPRDIAASGAKGKSLITVVKIGNCARPFAVRKAPAKGETPEAPFFCKSLEPGTAVIMTMEANLQTQHSVPSVPEAGPSGSIVFRTITRVVKADEAAKEMNKRKRE